MPKLPKTAVLDLRCNKLLIDGEEFPWYITEDGVDVAGLIGNHTIPALSFTIFAETVDVIPADSDAPGYALSTETTE
jgi:hypothetical protein